MNLPADYFYTAADFWLRRDGIENQNEQIWTLGLTDYGQNELGELVLIELPAIGAILRAGVSFGVVESVKAVSELVAPLAGEVIAVNEAVASEPSLPNESPFERGWLLQIRAIGTAPPLMNAAQYAAFRKL